MKEILVTGENIKLDDVWSVSQGQAKVKLSDKAKEKMQSSRSYIEKKMKSGDAIYGVNTGFGSFSSVRVSDAELVELQKNLIRFIASREMDPAKSANQINRRQR